MAGRKDFTFFSFLLFNLCLFFWEDFTFYADYNLDIFPVGLNPRPISVNPRLIRHLTGDMHLWHFSKGSAGWRYPMPHEFCFLNQHRCNLPIQFCDISSNLCPSPLLGSESVVESAARIRGHCSLIPEGIISIIN